MCWLMGGGNVGCGWVVLLVVLLVLLVLSLLVISEFVLFRVDQFFGKASLE